MANIFRRAPQWRELPKERRLAIRGRLYFAEPMSDPAEALIAANEARRQRLVVLFTLPVVLGVLLGLWLLTGDLPVFLTIYSAVFAPLAALQLGRTAAANDAVVAADQQARPSVGDFD